MRARFGTAGIPSEYRGRTSGVVAFLASLGLDAFEYEAVRGVRISDEEAKALGEQARKYGVKLSMHAPYYVNLGSSDPKIWEESLQRVRQALHALEVAGGEVVVVHPGYYGSSPKEAKANVFKAISSLQGQAQVKLGLETMGRLSQIGSLEEVVDISASFPSFVIPVIDWAHLEARSLGHMRSKEDVENVLDYLDARLGNREMAELHCHFSKMEFSSKGEVRHHNLDEEGFYPDFSVVAEAFVERGHPSPTFIAETSNTAKDALAMKETFSRLSAATQTR
ncbi:TIM barrel protein [Tardisphaera miroshnichenkoae]